MRNLSFFIVSLTLLAATVAVGQVEGDGTRTIQLVYHSDTRGHYLPCG